MVESPEGKEEVLGAVIIAVVVEVATDFVVLNSEFRHDGSNSSNNHCSGNCPFLSVRCFLIHGTGSSRRGSGSRGSGSCGFGSDGV